MRPYWMRVASLADRPAATRLLVEASGKDTRICRRC